MSSYTLAVISPSTSFQMCPATALVVQFCIFFRSFHKAIAPSMLDRGHRRHVSFFFSPVFLTRRRIGRLWPLPLFYSANSSTAQREPRSWILRRPLPSQTRRRRSLRCIANSFDWWPFVSLDSMACATTAADDSVDHQLLTKDSEKALRVPPPCTRGPSHR